MNSIGTLSEKSIHSVIKDYICSDKSKQEVKVDNFIADIKIDNKIYEIQTQNFKKLINKIDHYLNKDIEVIIVYPLVKTKYINWIDKNTGDIVERRKTPHKGVIQDIFKELYWIIDYIGNKGFSLWIVEINAEEYKYLDGYGANCKRRATKIDKVPTEVLNIIKIQTIEDLNKFIPKTLPEKFNSKDFLKHTKANKKWLGSGLKLLREKGIITVVGKQGNSYIYSRCT